jgi:hypothetical protein
VGLAVSFVLGWDLLVGGAISPIWVRVYGVATTVASVFFVYPSLGSGIFVLHSPDGTKALISSLANHLFFGVGLAIAFTIT